MKLKNLLLLAFTLVLCNSLFANANMSVSDPQGGYWASGSIVSAQVTITPEGEYFYYDLELELRAENTSQIVGYTNDSLEITCDFDLPAGAFIEAASLLIGDAWINAELMPRKEAHAIYEAVVKRRIDPLIIYKNSGDNYKFKIFPISTSSTRTMRLRYAVAASIVGDNKSALIPYDLLQASATPVDLKVFIKKSADFNEPQIDGVVLNESTEKPGYYESVIKESLAKSISSNTKLEEARFMSSKNDTDITYKFSCNIDALFNLKDSKKYLFIIDNCPKVIVDSSFRRKWNSELQLYENYSLYRVAEVKPMTNESILGEIKTILSDCSDIDSFNIIIKNKGVYTLTNTWIQNTNENVNSAIASVLANDNEYVTGMSELLHAAESFVNQDNVIPILISNSREAPANDYSSASTLAKSITSTLDLNKTISVYDVSVFDYTILFGTYNYYYYYNNFLSYLATNLYVGDYSYSKRITKVNSIVSNFKLDKTTYMSKMLLLNVSSTSNSGLVYDKKVSLPTSMIPSNEYTEIGKISEGEKFLLDISFFYKGERYFKKLEFDINAERKEILEDAWAVQIVDELNRSRFSEAIAQAEKISSENAILTNNTSFLALEPDIEVEPCYTCPDWNSQFPVWRWTDPIIVFNDVQSFDIMTTTAVNATGEVSYNPYYSYSEEVSTVTAIDGDYYEGYQSGKVEAAEDCEISSDEAFNAGYNKGYVDASATQAFILENDSELRVYPTIFESEITIELLTNESIEISIYTVTGVLVETLTITGKTVLNSENSQIASLQPGMYVVKANVNGTIRKATIQKK